MPDYAIEALEQELAMPAAQPAQRAPRLNHPAQARSEEAAVRQAAAESGIRIGPFRPDPALVAARQEQAREEAQHVAPSEFVPPAAERPEHMQPRMPKVEDFPPVAQRQMRARQAPQQAADDDRRPRGLLARIASGLSRRDEMAEEHQYEPEIAYEDAEPRVVHAQAPIQQPHAQPVAAASDFAKPPQPRRMGEQQPAAGSLDPRGRPNHAHAEAIRDEHLEIPAFLRRQSS
jgi:cell division protein FtsZ